ncbi:hypothetical protein EFW17_01550 [Halostreptopolyspora alba]|uniref:Uncharacterized protein n=1 Tax=Halostreptopolyspora alba TaxID=2487137 RepID=A0A3N0EIG6_9ACTN|nr:hypothetical protein EFW17_01550 [Nocardiopsaceae bacterium YIM 96095]
MVRRTGYRAFDFERADERAAMGNLLGAIVVRDRELDPREPPVMLSALVNYLTNNDAGPGFYQFAKDLHLLPTNASKDEQVAFWIRQVNLLQERHGASSA